MAFRRRSWPLPGEPLEKAEPTRTPLSDLVDANVKQLDNGDLLVGKDVLRRLRNERLRRATVSSVPSTPRYLSRDGGGVGVAKGGTRFGRITHETLRMIRRRSPMFQALHAARRYQIQALCRKWDGIKGHVGWRVVHKDHMDANSVAPEGFQPIIDRFEGILSRPSARYGIKTTADLMIGLEEDLLTINRPALEVLHSALDPERIVGFRPVDGAIIWPTLLWLEKWKATTPQWSQGYAQEQLTEADELQLASHAIGMDLFGADYCLVRDGILEDVYPRHKLIVAPLLNTTDINDAGYPPSHVEQAIEMGVGFINAWDFNTSLFTRGMMSEFLLGVTGDLHDDDVDAIVDMFREATQGVARAHQPPIVPLPIDGSFQKIDLKPLPKDMGFETLISLMLSLGGAIYRVDMSTINAKPWDGGQGPKLAEGSRYEQINLAKEEGLQADVGHLSSHMLDDVARRCHPDLRVVWEFGTEDMGAEAELYTKRAAVDLSRNDVRVRNNEKPRGFWVPDDELADLSPEDQKRYDDNPWNHPTDQVFASTYQAAQQAAAAGSGFGMPGPKGGDFGGGGAGGHRQDFGGTSPPSDDFGQGPTPQPTGPSPPGNAPPGGTSPGGDVSGEHAPPPSP